MTRTQLAEIRADEAAAQIEAAIRAGGWRGTDNHLRRLVAKRLATAEYHLGEARHYRDLIDKHLPGRAETGSWWVVQALTSEIRMAAHLGQITRQEKTIALSWADSWSGSADDLLLVVRAVLEE